MAAAATSFSPEFGFALHRARKASETLSAGSVSADNFAECGAALLELKVLKLVHEVLSAFEEGAGLKPIEKDEPAKDVKPLQDTRIVEIQRVEDEFGSRFMDVSIKMPEVVDGYERQRFFSYATRLMDSLCINFNRRTDETTGSRAPATTGDFSRIGLAAGEDCIQFIARSVKGRPSSSFVCSVHAPSIPASENYYHAWARVRVCELGLRILQCITKWKPGDSGEAIELAKAQLLHVKSRRRGSRKAFSEDPQMKEMMDAIQSVVNRWDPSDAGRALRSRKMALRSEEMALKHSEFEGLD